MKIKKYTDFFLDLIFPKYCVGCSLEGVWLCNDCIGKIIYIKKPFCPFCNRLTPKGQFCSRCRKKTYLTGLIIIAHYEEGPLKEAIHTFKYDGIFDIQDDLYNIIRKSYTVKNIKNNSILVPVPLHKNRFKERGFNQSELITKQIIKINPTLKLSNGYLIRNQNDMHQVLLDRESRIANMKGQFSWTKDKNIYSGKVVYLVDDIFTTGATLDECAKVIRENNFPKEVWGIVLAKG